MCWLTQVKLALIYITVFFSCLSFGANENRIAELMRLSSSQFDNPEVAFQFQRELPNLISNLELKNLPSLVESVAKRKGKKQYPEQKIAMILLELFTQFEHGNVSYTLENTRVFYHLLQLTKQYALNGNLSTLIGFQLHNHCSKLKSNWWERKIGVYSEGHQFCEDEILRLMFEFATMFPSKEDSTETSANFDTFSISLISQGYKNEDFHNFYGGERKNIRMPKVNKSTVNLIGTFAFNSVKAQIQIFYMRKNINFTAESTEPENESINRW